MVVNQRRVRAGTNPSAKQAWEEEPVREPVAGTEGNEATAVKKMKCRNEEPRCRMA